MHPRISVLLFPFVLAGLAVAAEEPLVPPADGKPILQLDAGGPMAAVTALAFGPDGKTLYVGGFDKVVRAWTWDEKTGAFAARTTYHVPIGPGMNGLINALAVSPDGRWMAAAGSGAVRGTAGFGDTGRIVPLPGRLSDAMQLDWGAIYLFDLTKDRNAVTPLRAHRARCCASSSCRNERASRRCWSRSAARARRWRCGCGTRPPDGCWPSAPTCPTQAAMSRPAWKPGTPGRRTKTWAWPWRWPATSAAARKRPPAV